MPELTTLEQRITELLRTRLNLVVPAPDVDMFMAGGLDSLSFVELLTCLEKEFGIKVALEDLELDNFRSISRLATFVATRAGHRAAQLEKPSIEGAACNRSLEHT